MRAHSVLITVVVLAAALSLPVVAQERRTIPVTVVDKQGEIVEGLTAANFRARASRKDSSAEFDVLAVEPGIPKGRYIVVVDATIRSRTSDARWSCVWDVAKVALTTLVRENEVELVTFGGKTRVWGPWNPEQAIDPEVVITDIKDQTEAVGRRLYTDVLALVIPHGKKSANFRGIVQITDGSGGWSRLSKKEIVEVFRSGPPVLSVQPPKHSKLPVLRYKSATTFLERLATESGGAVEQLSRRQMSDGCGDQRIAYFIGTLRRAYQVTIDFAEQGGGKKKWHLEVMGEDGQLMKGVTVHYPRYLVPLDVEQ